MSNCPRPFATFAAAVLLAAVPLAAAGDFPTPFNTEKGDPTPTSPEDALKSVKVPEGFKASLFAHEPEVQNPIGMAWDTRGRLWIAENYTYAERPTRFELGLRDRVLIFEDAKGDGHPTRKVFTDQVQMLTSVEVGRGGVWLMCPPQLLFIPDANGDDIPDGPPEVVLDGFTVAKDNYHNFANGLRWGPDGWLYGRCGASCPGEIGVPGTPAEQRIPLRGGIWRFNPKTKQVEVLNHGTTNPWGHDWDAYGELFFINTVNGHLWHGLTGAHFVRPHTIDPNPHAYVPIDMHADHWHFDTGKGWQASRDGSASDLGGGHAHCGAMIYQGDQWPEQYRNRLFTLNFHGRRTNVERLDREGSGYMGRHEADAFFWGDPWFRGLDLGLGPDGAAYVLDWSDTGECHESTGVHRTSGRIYKISYGEQQRPLAGVEKLAPAELVGVLNDANIWRARAAQRRLEDMAASGASLDESRRALTQTAEAGSGDLTRLRAMWALHAIGGTNTSWLRQRLSDESDRVRVWAIRMLTESFPLDTINGPITAGTDGYAVLEPEFLELAQKDPSGLVRATLASTLQRIPLASRPRLAQELVAHAEDTNDHDLPALVWFGLIPLGDSDPGALVGVADACEWPNTLRWISRRVALASDKVPAAFDALIELAAKKDNEFRLSVIQGASDAFRGLRKVQKPKSWDALVAALEKKGADDETKGLLRDLGALFGDGRALDEVKRVALDDKADMPARESALKTLIESRPPDLLGICEKLLDTRYLNATAVRGLALFDDPAVGDLIAKSVKKFAPADRGAAIETLASRPVWSMALLDQVDKGTIARADVTAFNARQIRNLGDTKVNERLTAVWGELHDTPADKKAVIDGLKIALTKKDAPHGDPSKGRLLFSQTCAVCHTLYGEGAKIGPDLTGSNRDNLDYLLENIVDPSAVVSADFRVTLLTLKDGRVLSGMVTATNDRTLTLRTLTESTTLDRADIAKTEVLNISMMPEGLLQVLQPEQVSDLFAYLMSRQQVPLPAAK